MPRKGYSPEVSWRLPRGKAPKQPWTAAEDRALVDLVAVIGQGLWVQVSVAMAETVGSKRRSVDCMKRWLWLIAALEAEMVVTRARVTMAAELARRRIDVPDTGRPTSSQANYVGSSTRSLPWPSSQPHAPPP